MSVCLKWDAGMPHFGVLKGTIEAEKPLELESQPGSSSSSTEWPRLAAAL